MTRGRDKQQWEHTCAVVVALNNAWCTDPKNLLSTRDIHPHYQRREPTKIKLSKKESVRLLIKQAGL